MRNTNFACTPNDAYFTIDPRPVQALVAGFDEFYTVVTGILEPFCGAGHMAEDLKSHGKPVYASDIHDYGYKDQIWQKDFLSIDMMPIGANSVITNWPYKAGLPEKIIRHALDIIPPGGIVAGLCRYNYDAGRDRAQLFQPGMGFYKKIVLPFRIWWEQPTDKSYDPAQDHAWFIWVKGWKGSNTTVYLDKSDFTRGKAARALIRPRTLHTNKIRAQLEEACD